MQFYNDLADIFNKIKLPGYNLYHFSVHVVIMTYH